MQVYLITSTGYYVRGVHGKGVSFTNQKEMAHCFNDMSVGEFDELKREVETTLKCELEVEFH
ncbi:hypothetical protein CVD28_04200 [Bacillus sp. M6-12]|uniref:hypothetical protein n=1 Tax=Bacillus sp. M6-12 TaxID=2054166 RepID=UPI000C7929A1|nr:hypothetical protein [Bacillus sp. M6-12]PLS19626.1 hypothetical protein CVD28_04200 [Bacillus sp. M6-12]